MHEAAAAATTTSTTFTSATAATTFYGGQGALSARTEGLVAENYITLLSQYRTHGGHHHDDASNALVSGTGHAGGPIADGTVRHCMTLVTPYSGFGKPDFVQRNVQCFPEMGRRLPLCWHRDRYKQLGDL